ncbi:MAG: helix-turn-helix transcriptional regulator [Bacteroidota bacterium]
MALKAIQFKYRKASTYHFDLVRLEDLLQFQPKDHSQFDHHRVAFFIIILITDGTGKHNINYIDHPYEVGTVFTLRKDTIHKFYPTRSKGTFLIFTEDFIVQDSNPTETAKVFQLFNELLNAPKLQLSPSEFQEIRQLVGQIEEEHVQFQDQHSIFVIRALMQALVHKLFRIKSHCHSNLDNKYLSQFARLQGFIEQHCFESKLVAYYAKKMGVTTRTLNNITQNTVGKSAKAFINEILILQIKRLIINSSLTYTEIAYESGFEDPSNFFKYFRKMTGLSPKQFKELS